MLPLWLSLDGKDGGPSGSESAMNIEFSIGQTKPCGKEPQSLVYFEGLLSWVRVGEVRGADVSISSLSFPCIGFSKYWD